MRLGQGVRDSTQSAISASSPRQCTQTSAPPSTHSHHSEIVPHGPNLCPCSIYLAFLYTSCTWLPLSIPFITQPPTPSSFSEYHCFDENTPLIRSPLILASGHLSISMPLCPSLLLFTSSNPYLHVSESYYKQYGSSL